VKGRLVGWQAQYWSGKQDVWAQEDRYGVCGRGWWDDQTTGKKCVPPPVPVGSREGGVGEKPAYGTV
jgi:hypothetical protein